MEPPDTEPHCQCRGSGIAVNIAETARTLLHVGKNALERMQGRQWLKDLLKFHLRQVISG